MKDKTKSLIEQARDCGKQWVPLEQRLLMQLIAGDWKPSREALASMSEEQRKIVRQVRSRHLRHGTYPCTIDEIARVNGTSEIRVWNIWKAYQRILKRAQRDKRALLKAPPAAVDGAALFANELGSKENRWNRRIDWRRPK